MIIGCKQTCSGCWWRFTTRWQFYSHREAMRRIDGTTKWRFGQRFNDQHVTQCIIFWPTCACQLKSIMLRFIVPYEKHIQSVGYQHAWYIWYESEWFFFIRSFRFIRYLQIAFWWVLISSVWCCIGWIFDEPAQPCSAMWSTRYVGHLRLSRPIATIYSNQRAYNTKQASNSGENIWRKWTELKVFCCLIPKCSSLRQ